MARITLQLGGREADNGRLRLSVFLAEIEALSAALHRADEIATGGPRATYFEIVALSYASPATLELEARPRTNKSPDVRAQAVGIFRDHLRAVESGTLNEMKVDYDLLEQVKKIVEPVEKKKLGSAVVSLQDQRFEMVSAYVQQIDNALAPIEHCFGSMDGMLEQMNIHAGANVFTLYPIVGPNSVRCHFGFAARNKALLAMGRRVEVTGKFAYRRDAPFPYEISDIQEIVIYPPVEELPNFSDLRGRAPDATGNKSSEDFIAELRSAWG